MEKISIKRSIWINSPRERVWRAVTEPAQIVQWFANPDTVMSQHDNIFSVRINGIDVDIALIEIFDPPRELTTRSLPDRLRTTTFLLEEENHGTRFTVIESGFESLSPAERQNLLDQNTHGWEYMLQRLHTFITTNRSL